MLTTRNVLAAAALALVTTAASADDCTDWIEFGGTPISVKICAYENGGSGYYVWRNDSDQPVGFHFEISGPGGTVTGAKRSLEGGAEERGSCYQCRITGEWTATISDIQ